MLDTMFCPKQLRSKLAEARAQGAKRVRRITRPTLTVGLLLMAAASVMPVAMLRAGSRLTESSLWVSMSLITVAAYLLILAVTPLQPRAVSRVAALLSVLVLVPVFYLVNTFVPAHLRNARADCAAYADPRTRCRVELVLLILRALCVPVNGAASAHLLWRLRRKASVFQRVDAIWVAFSASWFLPGLSAVIAFTTGTYISDLAVEFQSEASGVTMLFFSLLGMSKGVRRRAHGWLASIGGETSAAVTISTMFAGGGLRADEDMLARTHATLCSVSAAHVTLAAFCSSESADELFDATSPARLGEIDAFISHSWWDDPSERFAAFQAWRAEFKREHKREATVWLDKYCMQSDDAARSLPCLPLYVSGCRNLVLLRGPTLLGRMWCLIELFIFLTMRDGLDEIVVIPFGNAPSLDGVDATPEDASPFDVFTTRADGCFDARRASCTYEADSTFLAAVMDAFPGGIHRFNRELLAALARGEERWEARRSAVRLSVRSARVLPNALRASSAPASPSARACAGRARVADANKNLPAAVLLSPAWDFLRSPAVLTGGGSAPVLQCGRQI
ncbi:hypothetical protein KFE25_003725 [Diacronema lutheri]|uniref:Uncharacterized protein n=1 Tax=Diacronema lutheri TaxID=2081491 RepID=A0A8J5X0D3_DIALT|nr:hypothetical protein KFE25_003725 [Diacronema lutheri]